MFDRVVGEQRDPIVGLEAALLQKRRELCRAAAQGTVGTRRPSSADTMYGLSGVLSAARAIQLCNRFEPASVCMIGCSGEFLSNISNSAATRNAAGTEWRDAQSDGDSGPDVLQPAYHSGGVPMRTANAAGYCPNPAHARPEKVPAELVPALAAAFGVDKGAVGDAASCAASAAN